MTTQYHTQDMVQVLLSALEKKPEAKVIVIDGMCGSGKSTLAAALGKQMVGEVIHMDDFFLPFDLRTKERLSAPGGQCAL